MDVSGIIYIWKEPVLTPSQFSRLSNIFDNAGNVFLAVIVISPFIGNVDKPNWFVIVVGTFLTLASWSFSILLAKKSS